MSLPSPVLCWSAIPFLPNQVINFDDYLGVLAQNVFSENGKADQRIQGGT